MEQSPATPERQRPARIASDAAGDAPHGSSSGQLLSVLLFAAITIALIVNIVLGARATLRPKKPRAVRARPVAADVRDDRAARTWHERVALLGRDLAAQLDAFDRRVARWNAHLVSLLTNETGKRIASHPGRVGAFIAICEKTGGERRASGRIRWHLGRLLDSEDVPGGDEPAPRWDRGTLESLERLEEEIGALSVELARKREEVDVLTRAPGPASPKPLKVAVVELKQRWARERLEAKVLAQAAEKKRLDEFHARRAAEQAKLERLKEECQGDRVLAVLKPFITPSYRLDRIRGEEKARYSLIYLEAEGALEPEPLGYLRLVRCAVQTDLHPNPWISLTSGAQIKPEEWNAQQLKFVRNAQELLRKYGMALVSLGLLEP